MKTLQEQYDQLVVYVKDLTKYRHMVSYNDSYFGEPEGELKSIIADMERTIEDWRKIEDRQFRYIGYAKNNNVMGELILLQNDPTAKLAGVPLYVKCT